MHFPMRSSWSASPLTVTLPTRLVLISNELPKLADASATLASRLLMRSKGRPLAPHRGEDVGLTARDKRILGYLAKGLTNQEIAARLYLSLHTVKAHARSIYAKLGVSSRTQAVARGRALGYLSEDRRTDG